MVELGPETSCWAEEVGKGCRLVGAVNSSSESLESKASSPSSIGPSHISDSCGPILQLTSSHVGVSNVKAGGCGMDNTVRKSRIEVTSLVANDQLPSTGLKDWDDSRLVTEHLMLEGNNAGEEETDKEDEVNDQISDTEVINLVNLSRRKKKKSSMVSLKKHAREGKISSSCYGSLRGKGKEKSTMCRPLKSDECFQGDIQINLDLEDPLNKAKEIWKFGKGLGMEAVGEEQEVIKNLMHLDLHKSVTKDKFGADPRSGSFRCPNGKAKEERRSNESHR